MHTYKKWEELPSDYKTKTSLLRLGYAPEDFGPVMGEILAYGKSCPLYSMTTAATNALKAGRKTVINTKTKKTSILMDVNVLGWDHPNNEVCEMMLMNFDGKILFHKRFKPQSEPTAQMKKFLGDVDFSKELPISEYWRKILAILDGKTVLIPNKYNVFEVIRNTCQKYDLHLTCEVSVLDNHERLQKFFVTPVSLPQPKSEPELQKNCIMLISCLYPTSRLFANQAKAKYYFNALCNYNIRAKGEVNAYSNGYAWIHNSFGETSKDFEDYSLNTCMGIINGLQNVLETFRLI